MRAALSGDELPPRLQAGCIFGAGPFIRLLDLPSSLAAMKARLAPLTLRGSRSVLLSAPNLFSSFHRVRARDL